MVAIFTETRAKRIENAIRQKVINRTTVQYKNYLGDRFVEYTLDYARRKGNIMGSTKIKITKKGGVQRRLDAVDLTLTGQMLDAFYVKVIIEAHEIDMDGMKVPSNKINIKYGFLTRDGKAVEKYWWNAIGRIRKDGKSSARDFLGMANNEWLMREEELKDMIMKILRMGY